MSAAIHLDLPYFGRKQIFVVNKTA